MVNQVVGRDRFIFWLIILQPIIDLITSISNQFSGFPLSIGALSRALLMAFLFIYISYYLIRKKQKLLILFIASFTVILITMVVNVFFKENFAWFEEINFIIKTSYYLVMIYLSIILIENRILSKALILQSTKIVSLIIGVSYWLAIITGTSINSYSYINKGYSGWFYAANELSVIVLILLGIMIINLKYDKRLTTWLAFIFMLSMLPMVGTKTAFFGGLFIVAITVIYLLFTFNLKFWKDKNCLIFLCLIIIFICFIPLSPITSNTKQLGPVIEQKQPEKKQTTKVEDPIEEERGSAFTKRLLSSRNVYFQDTKADFVNAGGLRKAFGLGYAGDYKKEEPKVIEMDFLDMFFSYGVIGTLFLLLPLLYVLKQIMATIFPLNGEKILLIFTLGICFGIAFLAGHIVFAPSVITYIAILFILLGVEKDESQTNSKHYRTSI